MQRPSEQSQDDSVIGLMTRLSLSSSNSLPDLDVRFGKLREDVRNYERRLGSVWDLPEKERVREIAVKWTELERKKRDIEAGIGENRLKWSWEQIETLERRSLERLGSLRASLLSKKRDISQIPSFSTTSDECHHSTELETLRKAHSQLQQELLEVKTRLQSLERQAFKQ